MFTRKNRAIALMIYLIFLLLLLSILGENGIFVRAELKKNAAALENASERKAADIALLREEKASKEPEVKAGELLYSFEEASSSDSSEENIAIYTEFKAISTYKAALISLLPPLLYLIIVFLVDKRRLK